MQRGIASASAILTAVGLCLGLFDKEAAAATAQPSAITPTAQTRTDTALTSELTAQWWQWAYGIPESVHPLRTDPGTKPGKTDPSSDFCAVAQHGPVWFLGGSFKVVDISPGAARQAAEESSTAPNIVRECRVPLGVSILLPVLNAACDTAGEVALGNLDPKASLSEKIAYLSSCAKALGDAIETAEARFGPKGQLSKLGVQRVTGQQPFSVTYTPDNIFGVPSAPNSPFPSPSPSLAFDDGYWALVRPTAPGTYVLETFGAAPALEFTLSIRYIVTVVPPQAQ